MNVHGTHTQVGPAEQIGAHGKPAGAKNDCQIANEQFAQMLTQLIDKSQTSADDASAQSSAVSSTAKTDR